MNAYNCIFHKFLKLNENILSHPSDEEICGKPGSTNAENTHSGGHYCISRTPKTQHLGAF